MESELTIKSQRHQVAFVEQAGPHAGRFHCPCGAHHDRGSLEPGSEMWRCLACGRVYRVREEVELRRSQR